VLLTGSGSPLAVGRGEDAVQFGTAVAQEPEGGALATHGTEVERRHEDSLVPPSAPGNDVPAVVGDEGVAVELLCALCAYPIRRRDQDDVRNGVDGLRTRPVFDAFQVPEVFAGMRVVTPEFIARAHDAGVSVLVWTVNQLDDMRRLLEWGVDGLITDRPDLAVPLVRAWPAS